MTPSLEWQFGGWLRELPPSTAWAILAASAAAGGALALWLYRHTLRSLPPRVRLALGALRVALVLLLLLALANPEQVTRVDPPPAANATLAVLVDGSDSMTTPDHRGTTRLADALREWKTHEKAVAGGFAKTAIYRFGGTDFQPAADLSAATAAAGPAPETHLYAALREALATSPRAIVCLTDGLDTTSETTDALIAEAQRRMVPLYFAVGANRLRPGERLGIREVKVPSQVLRNTRFAASALFEADTPRAGVVAVELWSGDTRLASATLPVRAGHNVISWPITVAAKEPGSMPLEFRLGDGAARQIAACTTSVVGQTKVNVLYYQGALQWGYRYLLAALESDPSFELSSILNPALGVHLTSASPGARRLDDLPDNVAALRPFQIVVLAHVFADQLSRAQQQALIDYARQGGGVLFIAPDTNATRPFSGAPLEQMLPATFEGVLPANARQDQRDQFREEMLASGGRQGEEAVLGAEGRAADLPPLEAFAVPPGSKNSRATAMFNVTDFASLPKYSTHATVRGIKPGAEILAIRNGATGAAGALLTRQQFGDGFTALLATDLLWRWKMSLPSSSRVVEKFWQQLLLSLTPPPMKGLRLVKLTDAPASGAAVAFRVEDAAGAPVVEGFSANGEQAAMAMRPAPGEDGVWLATFTPKVTGSWTVRARDAAANEARVVFPIDARGVNTESLNLPSDVDGLRRLAESTGGALVGQAPALEREAPVAAGAPRQRAQPLWNSGWMLGLLLGLYGSELVARRMFRLL